MRYTGISKYSLGAGVIDIRQWEKKIEEYKEGLIDIFDLTRGMNMHKIEFLLDELEIEFKSFRFNGTKIGDVDGFPYRKSTYQTGDGYHAAYFFGSTATSIGEKIEGMTVLWSYYVPGDAAVVDNYRFLAARV